MTKPRRLILEELKKSKNHPSADQVWEKVKKKLPRISLATVYRNLELLADNELIVRLDFPNQPRRYDGDTSDHCHIFCVECGRIDDIFYRYQPRLVSKICEESGYKIIGYRLHILGICPECQKKKAK